MIGDDVTDEPRPGAGSTGDVVLLTVVAIIVAGYWWWALPYYESGAALFIWLHGAVAVGLVALGGAMLRTRKTWLWAFSTIGPVVGVPLWLYFGFIVFVFFGCRVTPACIS